MAGKEDQIAQMQNSGTAAPLPIPMIPRMPDDVRERFPSIAEWEAQMDEWVKKTTVALGATST